MIAGRPNVTVIRVSIIGPDYRPHTRGLLAWFLDQPLHTPVPGYTNWRWNGVTTLEWAQVALEVVDRERRGELLQPVTRPISKYDLLLKFRDAYQTTHDIAPVSAPVAVDRTLVPTEERSPIDQQLTRLREWYVRC